MSYKNKQTRKQLAKAKLHLATLRQERKASKRISREQHKLAKQLTKQRLAVERLVKARHYLANGHTSSKILVQG